MSKFTAGKWEVDEIYGDHYVVFAEGLHTVADCFGNEANTRLIAAAPEIYKLLKSVANYKPDFVLDVVFHAQELLARIDGKEIAND